MRLAPWTLSAVAAISLVGCTGRDSNHETGAASRPAESGMTDTGVAAPSRGTQPAAPQPTDTATAGNPGATRDTTGSSTTAESIRQSKGNQTKSGVTNSKTGKSTLGPGATQTRPDQKQPVMSKGDTLRSNYDSAKPKADSTNPESDSTHH